MTEIKSGGVIRWARNAKHMTQEEFGVWLAAQIGRDEPYSHKQISAWETGLKSPRKNVREACRMLAARNALSDIDLADTDEEAARIMVECQS